MGLALGEGLVIGILFVSLVLFTIVLGHREYKVSQRIIRECKESWRRIDSD
jgi:hypothetical protein